VRDRERGDRKIKERERENETRKREGKER